MHEALEARDGGARELLSEGDIPSENGLSTVARCVLDGLVAHVVNTSSGNGGLVLIPSTPIYSTSKSAVSTLTEALHLQLLQRDAKIQASVLYPGPHMVSSNIFSAWRNRPPEYEREVPHTGPRVTLDTLRKFAEQAGQTLATTTPEEVAEHVIEGLRNNAYFILQPSEQGDARLRERVENILQRRNP